MEANPAARLTELSEDVLPVWHDGGRRVMTEANCVTRDELRAELAEVKVDPIKWIVGTGLGIAAVTATLAGITLRSRQ